MIGNKSQLCNDWRIHEMIFSCNSYNGTKGRVLIKRGNRTSPIVLSAVHGVNHYRGAAANASKLADKWTGGMVLSIASSADVLVLANRLRHPSINPHLGETAMDRSLLKLVSNDKIRVILDIHGAKNNNFFDVAIGTGGNPITSMQLKVMVYLTTKLAGLGYAVSINPRNYSGSKSVSIVSRHKDLPGIAVLQIEICRRLRNPRNSAAVKFLSDFSELMTELGNQWRQ